MEKVRLRAGPAQFWEGRVNLVGGQIGLLSHQGARKAFDPPKA